MRLAALFLVPLIVVQTASPHGGRTDSSGGHYNRSTGEYHSHNTGYIPKTPSSVPSQRGSSRSSQNYSESYYQIKYANELGGRTEVTMPDGTRCDILTDTIAYEVDFADKWAEALGQSLNYAMHTGKTPGIILVLKDSGDRKHLQRLKKIAALYSLDIVILPHFSYEVVVQ